MSHKTIQADLYRYGGLKGTKGLLKGLLYPGFRYTFILRKLSFCKKYTPSWLFYTLLHRRYSYKYGFQIEKNTVIGAGFYIGHYGAIVINPNAVLGKNCTISNGITIGQTNRGTRKGFPVIGDHVFIGTGSVIVGGITIGSNVLIAPNSLVNIDVPEYSLVIGNPCKIIPHENPCESYINFTLEKD
jgi:serine O-acetyltransferase